MMLFWTLVRWNLSFDLNSTKTNQFWLVASLIDWLKIERKLSNLKISIKYLVFQQTRAFSKNNDSSMKNDPWKPQCHHKSFGFCPNNATQSLWLINWTVVNAIAAKLIKLMAYFDDLWTFKIFTDVSATKLNLKAIKNSSGLLLLMVTFWWLFEFSTKVLNFF